MLLKVLPKIREEQCDATFGKMGEGLYGGWSVARMVRRKGKVRAAHAFLDSATGQGVMKTGGSRRSLGQLGTRLTTTIPGRWRWEIIPEPEGDKAAAFVAREGLGPEDFAEVPPSSTCPESLE